MSIKTIIQSLERLVTIHEELIDLSIKKTEIVIEGSVDKLQQLLVDEYTYVQQLEFAESIRQTYVEDWFHDQQLNENMTLTHLLHLVSNDQEYNELEKITIDLMNSIAKLKQQEKLNHALIQQSMQFTEMSIRLMSPTIKNMNYSKKKDAGTSQHSVFDSRA